ncbi:MAG: hypothetical protein AB8G23_11800 [Myxococcota bacterium]
MRPYQIFAAMSPEKCEEIMEKISADTPEAFRETVVSCAAAMKFRPQYLLKQPRKKQVASVRRALSRTGSNQLAEELLAVYFLKCRLPLLTEWLDIMKLEHEEGVLQAEEVPCPDAAEVKKGVDQFRGIDDDEDRTLLLQVFSAQSSIEWPALEEILAAD